MTGNTLKVSKIIRELQEQMGGAILINDIVQRASEEDVEKEDVLKSLENLKMDGIISQIDDETIEFV